MSTTLDTFKNTLERAKPSIREVIPKGTIDPERFFKLALVAATKQPDLAQCDTKSLLLALMDSAALGLDCSGLLGQAYLVPYLDKRAGIRKAQLIIGYRGYISLAARDGILADVQAHCVYRKDKFHLSYGSEPKLIHEPNLVEPQTDEDIIGAYAVAWLNNGKIHFHFVPRQKLDAVKARSASQSGPWHTDYAEMARKTAVRALFKLIHIPIATATGKAIAVEEAREFAPDMTISPVAELPAELQEPAPPRKSERLAREVTFKKTKPPATPPPSFDEEPPLPEPLDDVPPEPDEAPQLPPLEALKATLENMRMEHLLEERRQEVLAAGRDWERELSDLCAMPPLQAANILRAWDIGRKAKARLQGGHPQPSTTETVGNVFANNKE